MYSVKQGSELLSNKSDALVIGLFENEQYEQFEELNEKFDGGLKSLVEDGSIKTKAKEVASLFTFGKINAKKLYFVGLGSKEKVTNEIVREAIAKVFKQIHKEQLTSVAVDIDSFLKEEDAAEEVAHILSEVIGLTSYQVATYKQEQKDTESKLEAVEVLTDLDVELIGDSLERGRVYANGTNYARHLVNTPGNKLTPTDLAEEAKIIAERHGMEISVLEKKEMEELGMGALLSVAMGSDQPPKMIVLKYQGRETWDNVLAYVGKGLTFDAGGISIKPSADMHQMKMDMGGAAAVLGAMDVIGEQKPEVNVLAVIPSSENLLNGSALKPGDVIHSLSGKTIEVRNTDAEGRLILADGITYAKQLGADYLVDVATLTGACLVAFGEHTTGSVTNNEEMFEELLLSSADAGERVWRLPNDDVYKEMLKTSDVADLNNSPGRMAGTITAGLFLGEFAGETPWVHLDIAGTAWASQATSFGPKGGTGSMVRTLANLAEEFTLQK
ncbi:leucyl aminopeptidase [Bacillus sp. FJAT-45350]|uniref:leucyl aminopeptidase n=1 Tax=Bacillus sp. FJAT-45350 TaxID=2011014 RepID=UPI000BB79BF0|nr:leucyl aminopeptidase [Bacillus sp. FJAT-45350]